MKNVPIYMDEETHKQLKMYAVRHETSVTKFVLSLIKKALESEGK